MKENFSIKEILKITKGKLIGKNINLSFFLPASEICTDTRSLKEGNLFIALKGKFFDGHNFIEEAYKKGACGAIVSQVSLPFPHFFLIQVKDTLRALQELSKHYRERTSIPLIAITGSNGKTTVKEMCYKIISKDHYLLKSEGNFNNQIGVPLSLLNLCSYHRAAVLEMGMNSPGEIQRLAEIIEPDIGVITNIHHSHLGFFKNIEEIKEAKAELITFLNKDRENYLVLNGDNIWTNSLKKRAKCQLITFGVNPLNNVRAENIKEGEEGINFILSWKKEKIPLYLPVPGEHNVYNALCASAVAICLKISFDKITSALASFKLPPLRTEITPLNGGKLINDSYNANPESMFAALRLLHKIKGNRKIAVLGDMLELGEKSSLFHSFIGEEVAKLKIDVLFTLGTLSREIAQKAKERGMREVFSFEDKDELLDKLLSFYKQGDSILIKGSRGMKMEEIAEKVRINLCSPS